jgi:Tol biopolymer transport system component
MPAADTASVRAELNKILASQVFVKSPRMIRFLKFVVEETLAGNGDRIKEYVVAIEVFDKNVAFDPQVDSTVRTEASKLRSRLGQYYGSEGREDPVVISIPKGAYVAVFEDRRNGVSVSPPAVFRWRRVAAVLPVVAVIIAGGLMWRASRSPALPPTLTPLTSYPDLEEQPSLSPDGTQVAFCWKGDIYVKQVGAEAFVQVTNNPAVDSWPAWSPDGTQIAFVRLGEVFLVSPLGGAERKVAESVGRVAWMPDGSALLVLQKTSSYLQSIFRVSLATGEKRRLTFQNDISIGDVDMAVSPDGRTIAFCRPVRTEGCELFVVPATGGEARRLTNEQSGILGLAWTSDGQQIVFASNRQGRFRLWRVPARPLQRPGAFVSPELVEGPGDDARYPSISRNSKGARLAYQRYTRDFDIRRAEIIGPEGAPQHHLNPSTPLITSTRIDVAPSFSPDGKKIAFVSDRSGARELWICEADGSKPLKLTSFAGPAVINPRWSPDGQRLIFSAFTGPGGNFEGYVIGARGGMPERIRAPGHASIAHPVFSHDGRWIYFIPGAQEGNVEAWKMPSAGGEAKQITRNGAFRPEESPDGRLLYYGKFGFHGLWSTPVGGGEERRLLDSITEANWTVTSKGIYYFDFAVAPNAPKLVKFYSFKTENVNQVGTVEPTVSPDFAGISVSEDGRWLLYSYIAITTADLMLVDHFRQ